MAMLNAVVEKALVSLFQTVADFCDDPVVNAANNRAALAAIRAEYEQMMRRPEVKEFYGELVDRRHSEVLDG
jgi:hypothetical protein